VLETSFRRAMENSILTGMRGFGHAGANHLCQRSFLPDDRLAESDWSDEHCFILAGDDHDTLNAP
jgi:hypothetical protein